MKRRPRGMGTIRREPSGEYAIVYGPRGAQKYEAGYPTIAAAERRLTLLRAEALRPLPPPLPPPPPEPFARVARYASFKTARLKNGCEVCGWKPPELMSARALHVHHVVPVASGGGDEETNLLLLCPNHHAIAHGMRRILRNLDTREAVVAALRRLDRSVETAEMVSRDHTQGVDFTRPDSD